MMALHSTETLTGGSLLMTRQAQDKDACQFFNGCDAHSLLTVGLNERFNRERDGDVADNTDRC